MKTGTHINKAVFAALVIAAVLVLQACGSSSSTGYGGTGGGGNGGGTTLTGSVISAQGTMTKGSVIVNGVEYSASSVTVAIRIDDNPGRPETELRDGMKVKVKGRINDDRITGTFDKVEAEPEVRGKMDNKGVDSIMVNGQHVFVDDHTVFEDRSAGTFTSISFNDLANLNEVEVHGGRDDAGNVRASRIERRDDNPADEVKGTISTAPTGSSFVLSNGTTTILVSYGSATITPSGATLHQNDFVEVHGTFSGGVLTAAHIDREDLEDAEFEPAEGEDMSVEGHITGFTAHPGDFNVGLHAVRTTATTTFVGGFAADLDNGVEVEAEGHLSSGVLIADKIKFERETIRIRTTATSHTASSVTLLGKVAVTNSASRLDIDPSSIVDNTTRVEMRGYEDKNGALIIVRLISAGGGNDRLQAPVTSENAGARTLVLMSGANAINADLSATSENGFLDSNGNIIGSAAFFAAVVPASGTTPGTIVRVRGTYSSGNNTVTVSEAEIEQ